MTIFCSKKLETFLGKVETITQSIPSSVFGDWNGTFSRSTEENV